MKLFEEFGSLTLWDIKSMLDELQEYYDQDSTRDTYYKIQSLRYDLSKCPGIENIYITALPIEVLHSSELKTLVNKLEPFMEDYYNYKDIYLQQLKTQMEQSRFIASYIQKAVKSYDKIQARQSSKTLGTGKK